MPKPQTLEKHTLRLRPGDVAFLRERFPKSPVNKTIRAIVAQKVDELNRPITEAELEEIEADD